MGGPSDPVDMERAYWSSQLRRDAISDMVDPNQYPVINWTALPGYASFLRPATGTGDSWESGGVDLPDLAKFLSQNNYTLKSEDLPNGFISNWAVDASGKETPGSRFTYKPANDSFGDILKDVGKLAAIMGTAYLGGTALAGSGSAAGSSGLLSPDLGSTIAASASDAVPSTLMGSGGMDAAVAASASGSGGSSLGNMASNAMNWMKANPTAGRLLMSGVSGLLSASGGSSGGSGGYKDSGYRPTITRGGWQPSVAPRSMALTPTSINLPTTGQPNSGLWRYGLLGG